MSAFWIVAIWVSLEILYFFLNTTLYKIQFQFIMMMEHDIAQTQEEAVLGHMILSISWYY